MSGPEIKERIEFNNRVIEEASHSTFTLNKQAHAAMQENKELQKKCPHEFNELGYCIYCNAKGE